MSFSLHVTLHISFLVSLCSPSSLSLSLSLPSFLSSFLPPTLLLPSQWITLWPNSASKIHLATLIHLTLPAYTLYYRNLSVNNNHFSVTTLQRLLPLPIIPQMMLAVVELLTVLSEWPALTQEVFTLLTCFEALHKD